MVDLPSTPKIKTGVSTNYMMITYQQDKLAPAELQAAAAPLLPMPEFNALKLTSIFLSQIVPV